jgi:hypothetical protein
MKRIAGLLTLIAMPSLSLAEVGTFQILPASEAVSWKIDTTTGQVWFCSRYDGAHCTTNSDTAKDQAAVGTYQISATGIPAEVWWIDTAKGQVRYCGVSGPALTCVDFPEK